MVWPPDRAGVSRELEFEGWSTEQALDVLQKDCAARGVQIYEGARLMGRIERSSAGFWIVAMAESQEGAGS